MLIEGMPWSEGGQIPRNTTRENNAPTRRYFLEIITIN